jgi:hypothetical protein
VEGKTPVSNIKESLAKILRLDGALGTCVVDSNSGMMLGADSNNCPLNLAMARHQLAAVEKEIVL